MTLLRVPLPPAMFELAPALAAYAVRCDNPNFLGTLYPEGPRDQYGSEGDTLANIDNFLRVVKTDQSLAVAPDDLHAGQLLEKLVGLMKRTNSFRDIGDTLGKEIKSQPDCVPRLSAGQARYFRQKILDECRPVVDRHLSDLAEKLRSGDAGVRIPIEFGDVGGKMVHKAYHVDSLARFAQLGLADEALTRSFAGAVASSIKGNLKATGEISSVTSSRLAGFGVGAGVALGLVVFLFIGRSSPDLITSGPFLALMSSGGLLAGGAFLQSRSDKKTAHLRGKIGLRPFVGRDEIDEMFTAQHNLIGEYARYSEGSRK